MHAFFGRIDSKVRSSLKKSNISRHLAYRMKKRILENLRQKYVILNINISVIFLCEKAKEPFWRINHNDNLFVRLFKSC